MAERDIIARLVIEGANQFVQETQKAATAEEQLNQAIKENTTVQDQNAKKTVSARQELKNLREELIQLARQGKVNTEEYRRLRDQAGELADAIGDASAEIKQAGSDTRGLDKALRAATVLTGAFTAVQGATALFGKESENLQKALLKVQAALSILNGLQAVQEELNRKDSIVTGALAKAKLAYAAAVGTATGATKSFRLALISIGIGVVIAGIALLVENWEKLSDAIGFSSKALRDNKKALDDLQASNQQYEKDLDRRIRKLQIAGATEKEIFDESTSGTKELIDIKRDELRLLEETIALEKESLTFTDILKNAIPFRDKVLAQKEKEAEIDKKYADQLNTLKDEIVNLQLSEKKLQDDRKKSITDELKKKEEARTKAQEEQNKALAEARKLADELEQSLKKLNKISFINREQINADAGSLNKLNEQINILKADLANLSPDNPEFDIVLNQIIALEKQLLKVQDASNRVAASLEIDFKKIGDAIKKSREDQEDAAETQGLEAFKREQERIKQIPILRAKALQEEIAIRKKAGEDVSELESQLQETRIQSANNIAAQGFKFFEDIQNARLAILQNKLKQGIISEEEYAREVAEINRKQAIADKAKALFDIAINAAVAIVNALKIPPPLGQILAGFIGTLAGIQAGIVASTPIPKFFKGVKNFMGGLAWVGDGGKREPITSASGELIGVSPDKPTLVNLPKGANVYRDIPTFKKEANIAYLPTPSLALPTLKENKQLKSLERAMKKNGQSLEDVKLLLKQGNLNTRQGVNELKTINTRKKLHRV